MTPEETQVLLEEAETNVRVAAAQVSKRFHGITTYADLAQEGMVWVLEHPGTVVSRLEDGRRGSSRLTNQIAGHMDRLARKDKASGLYEPEDEAFYSRTLVEAALPAVWDKRLMAEPPEHNEGPRAPTDLSKQNSWLATTVDVRVAYNVATMDDNWRTALWLKFGQGMRVYQVAEEMAVAETTANNYINKGIRAIIRELGGTRPGRCPPDCECGNGPAGGRKAISNAQARAETDRDYE
jgi:DNA-directed RNA polymerase specialized sigma24 family protein